MERLVRERRVRPSALLPVWRAAGFALGLVTGLMGKASAMAATVAVETSISAHYNDQVRQLLLRAEPVQPQQPLQQPLQPLQQQQRASEDAELLRIFSKHRDEEVEHHDAALSHGAAAAPGARVRAPL